MQEIIRGAEMQDARHDIHVRACDLGPGAPLSAGKRLPAALLNPNGSGLPREGEI